MHEPDERTGRAVHGDVEADTAQRRHDGSLRGSPRRRGIGEHGWQDRVPVRHVRAHVARRPQ